MGCGFDREEVFDIDYGDDDAGGDCSEDEGAGCGGVGEA